MKSRNSHKKSPNTLSRRDFIGKTAAATAAFTIVPRHVLGGPGFTAPSDMVNVAGIGLGNQGGSDIQNIATPDVPIKRGMGLPGLKFYRYPGIKPQRRTGGRRSDNPNQKGDAGGDFKHANIYALCDVDSEYAGHIFAGYPKAKVYDDFRKMIDKEKDLDAVVIGTPDHTHAIIAMEAMRRGKHVYCEKPLTHSVHEIQPLMDAAHEHNVVTQLGNQGHSTDRIRRFCEWVWDGAIGKVHEVHAFSGAFKDVYCQIDKMSEVSKKPPIPDGLDYDLWLGPAAYRPYSPLWVPTNWRGWMPFGNGCLGDWACHVLDPSFWALDLDAPTSVRAVVKGYDPKLHADLYPQGAKITYQFPAKGERGPIKLIWYDGEWTPPRPSGLEEGREVLETGALVYGDQGTIMHGSHGAESCRIIPETKMREYQSGGLPDKTIRRVKNHSADWLQAIETGSQAGSNFDYGGPLTRTALIGAIAIRFPGETLEWDAKSMKFTNHEGANAFVSPAYRDGWVL